jgi:hypothetical protein
LLGFGAELASLTAKAMLEQQASHLSHINALNARVQSLKNAFNQLAGAPTLEAEE